MGLTRRGFFKRVLAAGALALVPSLPRLPQVSGNVSGSYDAAVIATSPIAYWPLNDARTAAARDIWEVPFFRGSLMKMDNYGISSARVRQRVEELRSEMSPDQAFMTAVLEEVREGWG